MHDEDELRRALTPIDPGPAFTARVLAAVADARTETHDAPRVRAVSRWAWPALAASLIGAVVGARWMDDRREAARALEARAELMQALRLTSAKLNAVRTVLEDGTPR